MRKPVPVVDLFSGPGGLAEGFAKLETKGGRSRYRIELSIEKDEVAHRTLRLRAFLRKFRALPDEYYEYVNGLLPTEPDWATLYPEEWEKSGNETPRVELGTTEATELLGQRIRTIRKEHGTRTVLLGGPPCQSYSVAGRARNAGNPKYDISKDERLSLYKEYAAVLHSLKPWVAVMENVKGMLSAQYEDESVFDDVMDALQNAGGNNRYRLFALAPATGSRSWTDGLEPKDFLVRAEEHGVPQRRHRVFVICIRKDVAAALPERMFPKLKSREEQVALSDVVGEMPHLRSRLSRGDGVGAWQSAVEDAYRLVGQHLPETSRSKERKFRSALKLALKSAIGEPLSFRDLSVTGAAGVADSCPESLQEWLCDENLKRLPNNETRATFARTSGGICTQRRSPGPSGDRRVLRTSLVSSRRSTRTGNPGSLRIGFACNWPTSRRQPSPATSRRMGTTSYIPIRANAGASQFGRRPACRLFRITICSAADGRSNTSRSATPSRHIWHIRSPSRS